MPPTSLQLLDHWPVFGLALRTARLALRLPVEEDLAALATGLDPCRALFGV